MEPLYRLLLERLLQDLKNRQVEFRNDHAISTAIRITIEHCEQKLKHRADDGDL